MEISDQKLNLVQKLAKIRSIAEVVAKDKKGYNYTYSDINTILAHVKAGMKKYGVSLQPSIVPGTADVSQNVVVNTKTDKTGKAYDQTVTEMLVTADMIFKWVNDENPDEFIEVPWFVTGMQGDPSQALGSGLTYCTRYFLTNYFEIAQSDSDVDAYRSKQKAAEVSEEREIAAAIITKFDTTVKTYLSDNQDKAAEVKEFIGKYVKGSDYTKIKEPALASKLVNDFTEKYLTN